MLKRIVLFIILFAVLETACGFFIYQAEQKRLKEFLHADLILNTNNYNAATYSYRKLFTSVFNNEVNTPLIKYYLDKAYKNPKERDKYRVLLYQATAPVLFKMQTMNLENIHYHFPDNSSFLNMNYLDGVNDDHIRTKVNGHILSDGFNTGSQMAGYRYVFSLADNGRRFGSVEFIIEMDGLIKTMNDLYGGCYKYLIRQEAFSAGEKSSAERVASDWLTDSCSLCGIDGEAVCLSKDFKPIVKKSLKDEKFSSEVNHFKPFSYINKLNGKIYVMSFIPLIQFDGSGAGYIVGIHQDNNVRKIYRYYLVSFGFISLLILFVEILVLALDYHRRSTQLYNIQLEKKVRQKVKEINDNQQFFSQQAKMVTMGEMLSSILHQWKQPVNSISMLSDMLEFDLKRDPVVKDEQMEVIREIKNQTRFMSSTSKEFMEFFKPSANSAVFNVCTAVEEVIHLFEFEFARYNIMFSVLNNGECQGANIRGYSNEYKHILLNLFNNARDAISEKRDRLIAENKNVSSFRGTITVNTEVTENQVIVSVADTGGGIPDDIIFRIFEQFFSTKKENGTGIGLYMTKNLVEHNMNGTITVHNSDEGAVFVLTFEKA